jgi:2-polyprenyl-3-methyl-5-hydroxy-6-metoxy-1,4-benzoquinol methylase
MDYAKQQKFLSRSRLWGCALALLLIATAALCLETGGRPATGAIVVFQMTIAALAISLYYSPDYLHLTANPERKTHWEIKIRWRLIAAVLLLGALMTSNARGMVPVVIAAACLADANLLAKAAVPSSLFPPYFWGTDFTLLAALLLATPLDLLLGAALLAAAAHLSIVVCDKQPFRWACVTFISGALLIFLAGAQRDASLNFSVLATGLLFVSALVTAWLVHRAQAHNAQNIRAAMSELIDFTGYSADRIRHLWSTSNQVLAKNWQAAAIPEKDSERMAQWYRDNSELYLFAIDAYNLEYKRICSNLRMLKYAGGSCLDYGAGNGELILELARRGHGAIYYDVQGKTMQFARQRARQRGLTVEFLHSKDDLAATAKQKRTFDTIFSFDVLEHVPDLPGELDFLSSLLNPGGLLVFDVPAGSTKSHPMHLNHNLDVRAHLAAKGLEEKRALLQRLPFMKQEKYVFRARTRVRLPATGV